MNQYMKISINLIDPNPHQIREKHDEEMISSIAVSALGRHGILQAPMVRMKDGGRFETVYGHGRVRAAKVLGLKELECRVEKNVTDEEMRRYMGQENLLRSNLSEKERMAWLEQIREDLGLELDDTNLIKALHETTALPLSTIKTVYLVKEVRKRLKIAGAVGVDKIPIRVIERTGGIEADQQDRLILKTMEKGWSSTTAFKIKTAVQGIEPELRSVLLDKETDLTWKVIVAISGIEFPENALKIIDFIITRRLPEKTALRIIEDAKKGIYPRYEVAYVDKFEETFRNFRVVNNIIGKWSNRQYEIVKDNWDEIEPILTNIEEKIQAFRRLHRE